mmetsp:Transcript_38154/g.73178  ORF Transcript_38154/g.73178 Transcript_38154/m.73178 type:complete len:338 (-) Transcript_38154:108-1121(-)
MTRPQPKRSAVSSVRQMLLHFIHSVHLRCFYFNLNNFYWESRQVQRANHRNLMTLNCHCQKVDLFELGAGKDVRQGGRAERYCCSLEAFLCNCSINLHFVRFGPRFLKSAPATPLAVFGYISEVPGGRLLVHRRVERNREGAVGLEFGELHRGRLHHHPIPAKHVLEEHCLGKEDAVARAHVHEGAVVLVLEQLARAPRAEKVGRRDAASAAPLAPRVHNSSRGRALERAQVEVRAGWRRHHRNRRRLARYELQLAQRLHRHRQGRAQRVHLGNLRPQLLHLLCVAKDAARHGAQVAHHALVQQQVRASWHPDHDYNEEREQRRVQGWISGWRARRS